MKRRGAPLALVVSLAVGLAACGSSAKKATTTTARTSPTSSVVATTSTTVTVVTSDQSAVSSTSVATTSSTAAGRVVTSPSDNVKLGDSGSGVRQIQAALVAKGYSVSVDGKFGAQTEQAVKSFQAKNALTQDGIVGPVTWAKLKSTSTSSTTAKSTTTVKATTTTKKP